MLIIYVVVLIKCLSSKIMYYACTHTVPKFMIDRILTVRPSLIIRTFQLIFQPEQCFSLTTNQSEQCFGFFSAKRTGPKGGIYSVHADEKLLMHQ